ncbi:hypothetical protein AVEN_103098-1 [Araneus ventricosus]|uniref:Uncharacterized protein n=1 Tax=Araneus ventricosus TaxID=182803 RepID=A0A4Y2N6Z8_ARAVE|nr:hypothetical protein AVEN_103098-1 [Araneus ventricosus]
MLAKNVGMGRKHWTQLRRLLKERKKTINWDLDGKDWFLFGESGANYVSSFLTLNCWLLFGTILAGWCHMVGGCEEANRSIMDWCANFPTRTERGFGKVESMGETKGKAHAL